MTRHTRVEGPLSGTTTIALAAAALALAAACSVPTEGQPCTDSAGCPSGQACGADRRCSVKAAGCTQCDEGATTCLPGGLASCEVASDGVCRRWGAPDALRAHPVCDAATSGAAKVSCAPTTCVAEGTVCADGGEAVVACRRDAAGCLHAESMPCTGGLVCGARGAAFACLCPDPGTTFRVDPAAGSDAAASPGPSGADEPAYCRFRSIAPAVNAANLRAQVIPGAAAAILVSASGGDPPFIFAEAIPELGPGVTLVSDAAARAGRPPESFPYVLEVPETLALGEGAALHGFEVRPGGQGAEIADGIATRCAPGATVPAVVQDGSIRGTWGSSRFKVGVHQADGCPLVVRRVALEGNGRGVQSWGGDLVVDASIIRGGDTGMWLERPSASASITPVRATVSRTTVTGAADTGVQLLNLGSAAKVTFTGNQITGNCATTPRKKDGITRWAGGILFAGAPPTAVFSGNQLLGNGWDQVLVTVERGGGSRLDLRGGTDAWDCGSALTNQFCPDLDSSGNVRGVGLYSFGAPVDARFNSWRRGTPVPGTDFGSLVRPVVDAGQNNGQYCAEPVHACPPAVVTCAR